MLGTSDEQAKPSASGLEDIAGRTGDVGYSTDQWISLQKKIRDRAKRLPPTGVLGESANKGRVYRWGVAVAAEGPVDPLWDVLTRLATDQKVSGKRLAKIDLVEAADVLIDSVSAGRGRLLGDVEANLWAAALPGLIDHLHHSQWWELLSTLQYYRESVVRREHCDSPAFLIIGGELGLTLAWRLRDLPSCWRLQQSAIECVSAWCDEGEASIASAIRGFIDARLVFASLARCKQIIRKTSRRKFKKKQKRVVADLATWVAAMTTHCGGSAFSAAARQEVDDDTRKHGLLDRVVDCDAESLSPAIRAALDKPQPGGRLVWEVCLPKAFQLCDDSKVAMMLPQWDARRGRVNIEFGSSQTALEIFAGKTVAVRGTCETEIRINGQLQRPVDSWESTCKFSDDDVHYLELEQPWSGGIVLQRQVMVVRDDKSVLLADSILPSETDRRPDPGYSIEYNCRIPLCGQVAALPEPETREMFLADGRRLGLVMPLSASEWRIGPSQCNLTTFGERDLQFSASGNERLYAPLWFDFSRCRFDRKRTWRQLTVADNLRIVSDSEAVGFRVQLGSEQWMIYRSLASQINRSVLGKHLVAEFFSARFYASDGSLEELVTVDADNAADD